MLKCFIASFESIRNVLEYTSLKPLREPYGEHVHRRLSGLDARRDHAPRGLYYIIIIPSENDRKNSTLDILDIKVNDFRYFC